MSQVVGFDGSQILVLTSEVFVSFRWNAMHDSDGTMAP
jgi:hypothetical protein